MDYTIKCPCCNEKIKISIDSGDNITAFLLSKKQITQSQLFKQFGIELGIESEVNKNGF